MKFIVDESVEYRLVIFLRNLHYNVLSVAEKFSGLDDRTILQIANKEKRILITNDKDFGNLIYKFNFHYYGVILFRLDEENYQIKIQRLTWLLKKFKHKIKNHFIVIKKNKVRFTALK